jgi:hypothetical protein
MALEGRTMPGRKPSDIIGLKLRFREELRRQIEKSAKKRDLSLNSEIVRRLEQSFDRDRLPPSEKLTHAILIAARRHPRIATDLILKDIINEIEEAVLQPEIMEHVFDQK